VLASYDTEEQEGGREKAFLTDSDICLNIIGKWRQRNRHRQWLTALLWT